MHKSIDINSLKAHYRNGGTPRSIVEQIYDRIEQRGPSPVWISLVARPQALERASSLETSGQTSLPLHGIPFAVKDNIDVEGMQTSAACPAFAYTAVRTATVVQRLLDAGAILIGKTNMDQFATGLVGVRTPYGICSSIYDPEYISGGSSSGSAVAVADQLVSFSLGTDTAGSGRVPAAFNNLVGFKPTRGVVSTSGVVPACRSLDCVSIFSNNAADARTVFAVAAGDDVSDPYSRSFEPQSGPAPWLHSNFRFGVLKDQDREFFGDVDAERLYDAAIAKVRAIGGTSVEMDFDILRQTAELLYSGPWVSERMAAIETFFAAHPDELDPTVRKIISGADRFNAVDTFKAAYKLAELQKASRAMFEQIDLVLLPTTGTIYKIDQVLADPIALNSNLGRYTNFVNLLDLAAIAIPAGFRQSGLPFGVTLIGPAHCDLGLLEMGGRLHRELSADNSNPADEYGTSPGCTSLAVVGAHLTGQPLNHQLTSRGARLVRTTKTMPHYKLYALPGTVPEKPGLVKSSNYDGPGIEVEVWDIPTRFFGSFVAEVPPPLGIGNVELEGGAMVKGFICETYALENAVEITSYGGWRNYRARQRN